MAKWQDDFPVFICNPDSLQRLNDLIVTPLARGNIHGKIHREDKINDFRGLAELLLSVGGKEVSGIIHLQ